MKLCECGCGREVAPDRRFIHGHNHKGKHLSEKNRLGIGRSNRGKVRTKEMRDARRAITLRWFSDPQNCEKLSKAISDKWEDPVYRGKMMAFSNLPKVRKARSREAKKQWKNPSIARKMIERNVKTHIERAENYRGVNSHFWRGGIAYFPYSPAWTRRLKRSIRERDNYTCQVCGALQEEVVFPVHHIDYNKENCDRENLITLCRSCHSKTNSNRGFWIEHFKKISAQIGAV